MKKIFVVVMAVAFTFSIAGFALATSHEKAAPAATPAMEKAPAAAEKAPAAEKKAEKKVAKKKAAKKKAAKKAEGDAKPMTDMKADAPKAAPAEKK